jgi:cell division protein FtsW (lipid II flippase)
VTARRTELGLLILGLLVVGGAYSLAALGRTATLPANLLPFLLAIIGLLAAAHVAVRRFAPRAEMTLLPIAGLLNGIGYVFIARLDEDLAGLQATWTALGIGAFVVTLIVVRRVRDLEHLRYTVALIGIVLLLLPLAPGLGRTINGARLWVRLGPVNFQPGEFAKIALAVFFAAYLVEYRALLSVVRRIGPFPVPELTLRVVAPILAAWGVSLVIIMAEKDLGSSLLFFALFVSMLWIATGRAAYLVVGAGMFAAGALFAWSSFEHVKQRVRIWIDPWTYAADQGFQIVQGLFALGSGGVTGTGISLGSPQKIPAAATDFIFAAIGEELGLLGTTAVLVGYVLLVGAGLRIALRTTNSFEKLLAAGLTTIVGLQAFIIIGGITRVVPLTGITLPFVSYGGSSLLANYILLALLLRISHETAEREAAGRVAAGAPT